MISSQVKKRLKLPSLSQIGYIVPDAIKMMEFYRDAFGLGPWMVRVEKPDPCMENGKRVYPTLKFALAYSGPIQIELIQVMEGETFHLKHLENSTGAIHHLGFTIRNLETRLKACKDAGISILQQGTIKGTGYVVDYAYIDTTEQAGTIIELMNPHFGPLPLPTNKWTHNLAAWFGPKET